MNQLTVLAILVAIAFVGYRAALVRCRRDPRRRLRFILGSIALLGLAGLLVPWLLGDLDPPWSESPAGILVYLGRAIIVVVPGLLALGALIGALVSARGGDGAALDTRRESGS